MSFFSRFPYTDFHRLNADWILDKVKEAVTSVTEALGLVRQSAADAAAAAAAAQQAVDGSVRYDQAQTLTEAQQRQAQTNMNVVDASVVARLDLAISNLNTAITTLQNAGNVRYDQAQQLTVAQQAQARENIGAASDADLDQSVEGLQDIIEMVSGVATNCVRYDGAQGLTQAQQAQARDNIACAPTYGPEFTGSVALKSQSLPTAADDVIDMYNATLVNDTNSRLQLTGSVGQSVTVSGVASPTDLTDAANKSYVDGRITANAPLLVQFTGSNDTGDAACNRTFNEVRNALFNNRAVRMVCVVGQMQYDLIPTRYTGSTQSVGGHVTLVTAITDTGVVDSYITISCSISATDHVSVQVHDNL